MVIDGYLCLWVLNLFFRFAVASASHDTTIKLWKLNEETGRYCDAGIIRRHKDYIKTLAWSPGLNKLASGGLDCSVFVWDLEHAGGSMPVCGMSMRESIYALGMASFGSVLISGSSEKILRVWDPRTGGKVAKLHGHTDTVKSICVDRDGTRALSAGSDGSIKLWDLGEQRCVQSFDVHQDSVWALAPSHDWNLVYSGGRDRTIYATNLVDRSSTLVAEEEAPVLSLGLDHRDATLWASTTQSSLRGWNTKRLENGASSGSGSRFSVPLPLASSPSLVRKSSRAAIRPTEALESLPEVVIPGSAALCGHRSLLNRRQVVTVDTDDNIAVWDVTRATKVREWKARDQDRESPGGPVDLDIVLSGELAEQVSISSWFSADTRLGSLSIHLDHPYVFGVDLYRVDAGFGGTAFDQPEERVNIGGKVVEALFRVWKQRVDEAEAREAKEAGQEVAESKKREDVAAEDVYEMPLETLVVISDRSTRTPALVKSLGDFSGEESDEEIAATWVVDYLMHGAKMCPDPPKIYFYLWPWKGTAAGGGTPNEVLPELPSGTSRLSAPRILRMHRACEYVVRHLDISLPVVDGVKVRAFEHLELLVGDEVLDPVMSLATVRAFYWKRPEELELRYRIKSS